MRPLLLLLITLLLPELALAATPEEAGLAIATEARTRDRGWGDLTVAMTMTLRNAAGEESGRELRVKMLEVEGDGDKSLSLFDLPRDIAGTAFLSYTHALTPDDQWLYLPALKRVKRISSANKSLQPAPRGGASRQGLLCDRRASRVRKLRLHAAHRMVGQSPLSAAES
jgi:hypothetical protein